jgi:hypothetical protein
MSTYKLRDTFSKQDVFVTISNDLIEIKFLGVEFNIPVDELTGFMEDSEEPTIVLNDDMYFTFHLNEFSDSGVLKLMSENFAKPFGSLYTTYEVGIKLLYLCKKKLAGHALPTQEQLDLVSDESSMMANFNRNSNASLNTRIIPAGSQNALLSNAIRNGNRMVNFQGEYGRGRYYKQSTYNKIPEPKRNPFSRERITYKTQYKAHVPTASGGRRKTRKSYKGRKGTRKGVRK